MNSQLTELECVLLAFLQRKARSGYELGKLLGQLPMAAFSSSPGSVYPALRRLERGGLVRTAHKGVGSRPRRECSLSEAGHRRLRSWLLEPVTENDLLRRPGVLALRYSFLTTLAARASFLRGYADASSSALDRFSSYLRGARSEAAAASIGALELVVDLLATHRAWAEKELDAIDLSD